MKSRTFGKGIAKGMGVTMKTLLTRKPITTQYPEQKLSPSRRTRGNEFVWKPEKCTGCATCARACPQGEIKIVTTGPTKDGRFKVVKFEVDTGRCMFCGLCVESCPYDALYIGRSFERGCYRRGDLVLTNEAVLESETRRPSGYARPKLAKKLPKQTLLVEGKTKS